MLRGYSRLKRTSGPAQWLRTERAGGVKRKLLALLVLLIIVVALLPTIIAKTSLRNTVVSALLPSDAIRVSIGGASFSWVSSQAVTGLQVSDSAGNPLLTAESLAVNRAPLSLLTNSHELGVIQINRPAVYLKVRPDGSNLEDALHKLLADLATNTKSGEPDRNTSGAPLAYTVQLIEGTVFIEDLATGRLWRIDGVNVQYDCHGANGGLGNGSIAGQISVANPGGMAPTPAGRLAVLIKPNAGRNELNLQAEGVALAVAKPWLQRFANVSEINGTLSGNGVATWTPSVGSAVTDLTTSGMLKIDGLDTTAPQLQGDRVRLAHVELPWRIVAQPNALSIEDLQLKSDVAQLAVRGRIDQSVLNPVAKGSSSSPLGGNNDVDLHGTIDVARLATMLPHALGIRSDTTITSGSIEIIGRLQPSAAGQSLTGSVRAAQLAATSAGKPLTWDQPVSTMFAVRRENGTLALDKFQCESKFLRAEASGTIQKLSVNASFDLNSLAEQLGQFVDLSHTQLAGTGTAQLTWQQTEKDKFTATASSDLTQLRVVLSDGGVWSEPQLTVRAQAAGLLDPISHQPTRVDNAQLQVNGQGDVLDARLIGPASWSNKDAVWPLTVRSTGSIARWLTRARPWFAPGDWKIDGASDITANIRATSTAVDITDTKVTINNLQAVSPGWNINEPRAEFAGDAHYNLATGEFAAQSAQFVTSTVSIATKDVRYANNGQLAGAGAFRADLARLAAWRATPGKPAAYLPAGQFTGNVRFAQQGGRVTGELVANGENLILTSTTRTPASPTGGQPVWQEPKLTIRGNTNYDASTDRLTLDQFQIQSNTLQANVTGQVERLSTAAECNLNGALNYDLAQVSPLLRPYIGEGVQLNGREQARFVVAGQLMNPGTIQAQPVGYSIQSAIRNPQSEISWSRRIHAQLELPWSGANVYGLPVGPGKLDAKLGDGAVQIAPIALTVGEGRLNLAPNVRFDPEPSELTMPAGPVITNVRISPQVSEAMLKFVAPVLAGATQSEGQFSLDLEGLRMPLADSKKVNSAGKLTVHSVRVTPGPTTQPFFSLAQQIEALVKRRDAAANRQPAQLLSISDQQVNFRVAEGRVYHQNIEFQVGDVIMRSQGSVGLDETIALTIQIPVQDAWITKEPLLAGLKGQSLQVPVGGTLKRPQLDQRAIANLSGQLIQNAAGQAVGNEINKALDKFLKPRQ
jgi:hypothetical protein